MKQSQQTVESPKKKNSKATNVVSLILLLGLIGYFGLPFVRKVQDAYQKAKAEVEGKQQAQQSQQSAAAAAIPADQAKFIQIINEHTASYAQQPNELKASAVATSRQKALEQAFPSTQVSGWIGEVKFTGTTTERKGMLGVKLAGGETITLKTHDVAFLSGDTLIDQNSDLYQRVAELQEGQFIRFSGSFKASKKTHFIENSVTEAGSMKEPSFLFKFDAVEPHQ